MLKCGQSLPQEEPTKSLTNTNPCRSSTDSDFSPRAEIGLKSILDQAGAALKATTKGTDKSITHVASGKCLKADGSKRTATHLTSKNVFHMHLQDTDVCYHHSCASQFKKKMPLFHFLF